MSAATKVYHDTAAEQLDLMGPESIGEEPLTNLEVNPAAYMQYTDDDLELPEPDEIAESYGDTPRAKHTRMTALASHPASAQFMHHDAAAWHKRMGVKSLAYLVWAFRKANACGLREQPSPMDDDLKIVNAFFKDAPSYQRCALDTKRIISQPGPKNKVIVYTQSPLTSQWVSKMFNFQGIPSLLLTSSETPLVRHERIKNEFNCEGKSR